MSTIDNTTDQTHDTLTGAMSGSAARGNVEKLKGDFREQTDKAKEAAREALDKTRKVAKEWADQAPEQARVARERAQKLAEEGGAKVRAAVQEQPFAVLGAGVALGFLVGWMMSGRKN